ncbi:NADH:flavin oxidoreductase/NADH oxidase [Sphingobium chlorophenolicum]|uniref:NADH:flavin oxidoreductase/NADH oxidase n=1 Tax=Sphingobium chlorophenolicum TaxID=46429 RepID=A0A081RFC8_SPHCR|nr:NADH:flavin oxidoreductase/NADH oxidase [Sphingobium chlorophenolicum]
MRPCIDYNHGCVGGLLSAGRLGCAVNPAVGQEARLSEDLIVAAETPLSVLVVGGGPPGMEAAGVDALSGHRVTLVEANNRLGGCVNIAKRAPWRIGIGDIADWLEREIYRLGVDVRLSSYFQAEDLAAFNPDAVIVATGSMPRVDGHQMFVPGAAVPGTASAHVVSSHDVLMAGHRPNWGPTALVFDDTGHYEAIAAAEYLADRQVHVTFATSHASFAPGLMTSVTTEPALRRLLARGVDVHCYAQLVAVDEGRCRMAHRLGGTPFDVPADTVVLVQHNLPNRLVADELSHFAGHMAVVGDALGPRYLQTAIREGHLAARSLAHVARISVPTTHGV